jgi:ribosomal protein S2
MSETPVAGTAGTAALDERVLSIRSLLEAGAHFGHQTRRWNPRMKDYIYGERQGIHILNLDATFELFQEALEFLRDTATAGGKVLFVGTKRQAAPSIESEARRGGQYWVCNRWLGGMLTNFKTVKKSVERFKEVKGVLEDEARAAELSKRDRSRMARESEKLRRSLEGIQEMTRLPDALFIIDVGIETSRFRAMTTRCARSSSTAITSRKRVSRVQRCTRNGCARTEPSQARPRPIANRPRLRAVASSSTSSSPRVAGAVEHTVRAERSAPVGEAAAAVDAAPSVVPTNPGRRPELASRRRPREKTKQRGACTAPPCSRVTIAISTRRGRA